jgi:hypothetical protein
VALNDVLQLAVNGTYQGEVITNTYNFRQIVATPGGASPPEQSLIDSWQSTVQDEYLLFMPNGYTGQTYVAKQVAGVPPLRSSIEELFTGSGTRSLVGDRLAAWLAIRTKDSTGLAGRRFRSSNFYPLAGESDVNGTLLDVLVTTPASNFVTAVLAAFGPTGTVPDFRYCTFSRTAYEEEGGTASSSSALITATTVGNRLTSMRSRRSRTGA